MNHALGTIQSRALLYLKGGLFLLLTLLAGGALLIRDPSWEVALLAGLLAWAAARSYYFAFYVVEHYVDASYRYAGLWDLLRHATKGSDVVEPTLPDAP